MSVLTVYNLVGRIRSSLVSSTATHRVLWSSSSSPRYRARAGGIGRDHNRRRCGTWRSYRYLPSCGAGDAQPRTDEGNVDQLIEPRLCAAGASLSEAREAAQLIVYAFWGTIVSWALGLISDARFRDDAELVTKRLILGTFGTERPGADVNQTFHGVIARGRRFHAMVA